MKLRVKFSKYGNLRFIGHLDVMRYFQKALRRAHIDVAYSTGFSPHQIMSFASPLGLGICSNAEYMDIEANSVDTSEAMRQRLQAAGTEGIDIISIRMLPEDAGNAMASVAAARYTVYKKAQENQDFDRLGQAVEKVLAKQELIVMKEGKKGLNAVDIRPGIYDLFVNDKQEIEMLVDASSAGNVKPSFVLNALWEALGETEPAPLIDWQITRQEMYTNKDGALISLEDVGELF